jgi:hypothetical protein
MKKNEFITNFLLKLKKLRVALLMPMSITVLLLFLSSLTIVNAQPGNQQQERTGRVPLAERIGHTDKSKAMEGKMSIREPGHCLCKHFWAEVQ